MMEIDGASLGLGWVAPFFGLLVSIAVVPLISPRVWHHHFATFSLFWAAAFLLPFGVARGASAAVEVAVHALLLDYLPFIVLLTVLYIAAGGIRLTGTIRGTPGVNTLLLLIGSCIASVMGTTGAAMLMVRPLIRANSRRRRNTHVFVFLIILVANIGGALTPLGDPPLLIGFLQGVPFFWPTVHLLLPTVLSITILLAVFYVLDRHMHRRGWHDEHDAITEIERLGIDGKVNIPLLAMIPVIVFAMGAARGFGPVLHPHFPIDLATLLGNVALLVVAAASWRMTSSATRSANHYSWRPMAEVAAIFAAIFLTIVPALIILRAGSRGALAPLVALVAPHGKPVDAAYFWLTGALSSFLDNAPTYLIFFNLAGGDPVQLTGPMVRTLVAISAGAVLMGANTYVGNAPNFMVKAVCQERGIAMPSFFGYMGWAAILLMPIYLLLTVIFFR